MGTKQNRKVARAGTEESCVTNSRMARFKKYIYPGLEVKILVSEIEQIKRDFFSSFNTIKNKVLVKECFHEDKDCSNRIIKAHSVQNNKILNAISQDGMVLMFDHDVNDEMALHSKMKPKGRKGATTFTGFCGHHDTTIFNPIENFDYEKGNKEQDFLFAYRALAKEYHSKKSVGNIYRHMLTLLREERYEEINKRFTGDNIPSEEHKFFMQELFSTNLVGNEDAEQRFERFKGWANNWLNAGEFNNIVTHTLEFEEEYHLAVSSTTYIERDLNNNIINELSDWETMLAPLFITVFPQNGKTYVLLSHFARNNRRYRRFAEQIVNSNIEEQKIIISNIILAYIENFAFSPTKWDGMSKESRDEIESTFLNTTFEIDKSLLKNENVNLFV